MKRDIWRDPLRYLTRVAPQTRVILISMMFISTRTESAEQSIGRGKELFSTCAACHSLKENENQNGPSLFGVFGRQAGTVPGFRYSNAMKRSGITWTKEAIDGYITDPQLYIPGNRMPFSGEPNIADRAALIEYLAAPRLER